MSVLKSPFPYFGSKKAVGDIIWKAFGNPKNYIEPFAGSLSVLFANPNPAKIETVNDIDCYLVNFWRATIYDVDNVIKYADVPVNEIELHARHRFLINEGFSSDFKKKLENDPEFYDSKAAGYWLYGMCGSIPGNWLRNKGLNSIPMLGYAGTAVQGLTADLRKWLEAIKDRLKRVRVTCGDWKRVVSPAIAYKNKGISSKDITAILLDPPYSNKNRSKVYLNDKETDIYSEVCDWAINNYNDNQRIAVCGYEGDFIFPNDWKCYNWSTSGGFANKSKNNSQGKINSKKEVIYFSPNCLDFS
jgi:DNA adenine methylase